ERMVKYESFKIAEADESEMPFNHIQAVVDAEMTIDGKPADTGMGVLEQMIIGRHEPSGFTEMFDLAKEGATR
ncbi:MAG: hypothetical protein R3360_04290, partial [Alphaproteobacteria bacterium]|nr:hypothetical protein [Alphaproteobacteria bacterium]